MSSNYSGPRMGMNQMNGNNRRPANLTRVPSNEKPALGQHEDLVKFMQDSWNKVVVAPETDRNRPMPVYYNQEADNPNPLVKDFVAFDLEGFWGMRVVMREQNFTTTQPQQQQHS